MNVINAQTSWAAPEATWYYTYDHFAFAQYIKIEKVEDTLINGIQCDVLQKTRIGYDYVQSLYDTVNLGREYTFTSLNGDTVFYFRNNKFYILYAFNALPGNMWIVCGNNSNCPLTDTVRVDSIGYQIINSDTLRYLWTSKTSNAFGWYFTGKIIEKIGCIGYMFPEPYCQVIDNNEGGPFRCYNDSSGWQYTTNIVSTCDFTTSVNELQSLNSDIYIYPNPFFNFIQLDISYKYYNQKITFVIFDAFGKVIYKNEVFDKQIIDGTNIMNGIYFWKAYCLDKNIIYSGKIIKH